MRRAGSGEQILLAADAGASDEEIARSVRRGRLDRVQDQSDASWERALSEEPRPGAEAQTYGQGRSLAGRQQPVPARPRAVPAGRSSCWQVRWSGSPNTRACRMRRFGGAGPKRASNPGARTWCIPKVDGEYVARMEDVLDLYAEVPDAKRPVVCFDESRCNSSARRQSRPSRVSNVTITSIVAMVRSISSFSSTCIVPGARSITDRRAAEDYAQCMRDLVDIHYPDAEIIRVVQDNLSTHSAGSLYQTFPPPEARRILRRLEFHYTPKHASWLNMVEIRSALCAVSTSIAGSTTPNHCAAKSQPGSGGEMPPAHASNGCSQQTMPAPKWAAPIPTLPKSHNHCAEPLVVLSLLRGFEGKQIGTLCAMLFEVSENTGVGKVEFSRM